MPRSIATDSCNCQQLKRVGDPANLQPMVANTKDDFAKRLNTACGNANPPIPQGRGRTAELCRRVKTVGLSVSGESVRKWLAGESIPSMDNIRYIARALEVDTEWLLTGAVKYISLAEQNAKAATTPKVACDEVTYGADPTTTTVVEIMRMLDEPGREKVLFAARLALDDHNRATDQNSTARAG